MHSQLAFCVGQPLALLVHLLLGGLLGQLPFCGVELLSDLGDPLLFVCELPFCDRLADAGVKAIEALLRFREARALAIHGHIVGLAVDLASDGI